MKKHRRNVDTITQSIKGQKQNIDTIVGDFDTIVGDFDTIVGDFDTIVGDFDAIVGDFDTIVGDFDTIVGDFDTIIGDFDTIVGDFDTIVGDFDTIVGNYELCCSSVSFRKHFESTVTFVTLVYQAMLSLTAIISCTQLKLAGHSLTDYVVTSNLKLSESIETDSRFNDIARSVQLISSHTGS